MYDLGMVDSKKGDSDPFHLEWTIIEIVDFSKVDLGEIELQKVGLEQTYFQVYLGKISIETTLSYMGC